MNKNRVKRHEKRDKLAQGSKVQKGSKLFHVNVARVRGKLPNLIWGGLSLFFEGAEVSRSHSSRWSNDHPRGLLKGSYRAKGRTDKKLRVKEQDSDRSRHLGGKRLERRWREG